MNRLRPSLALALAALALAAAGCSGSSHASAPSAGTPLALRVDAQPSLALPGAPFTVSVSVRDGGDRLVAGAAGSVTLALAGNPSGAVLGGTTARPIVNGLATFDDVAISAPGQGYTVTATAPAAAAATSRPFDLAYSTAEAEAPGSGANDVPAGAEPIFSGVPVFASLSSADDVDVYRFHAQAGQLLSVATYATRLDLDGWDAALLVRLLGPDLAELQRMGSTETGLLGVDHGLAQVRIPADGDYYLSCEADPAGLVTGRYALVMQLAAGPGDLQRGAEGGQIGHDEDAAHAQPLAPGVLHAFYQSPGTALHEAAYYRITIAAPTRVRLQLLASRNGDANGAPSQSVAWDGELELLDSAGDVLWSNDDTWLLDPSIDYVVATPGDYLVRVRRFGADAGSTPYFLSYDAVPYQPTPAAPGSLVTYGEYVSAAFTAPGETQTFRFSGSRGDLVRVWIHDRTHLEGSPVTIDPSLPGTLFLDGSVNPLPTGVSAFASLPPGDSNVNSMQTILQSDGTQLVRFTNGAAAGAYGFLVERIAAAGWEAEPNGGPASANAFGANGWIAGAIAAPGDEDAFAFRAEEGQLVSVALIGRPGHDDVGPQSDWGSTLVPALAIVDGQGHVLSRSSALRPGAGSFAESVCRPDSTLEVSFRAPAAGDYFVVVSDANGAGGASAFYALHLIKDH